MLTKSYKTIWYNLCYKASSPNKCPTPVFKCSICVIYLSIVWWIIACFRLKLAIRPFGNLSTNKSLTIYEHRSACIYKLWGKYLCLLWFEVCSMSPIGYTQFASVWSSSDKYLLFYLLQTKFWGVHRDYAVCSYVSFAQLLLNRWTDTAETLLSCIIGYKHVYEGGGSWFENVQGR